MEWLAERGIPARILNANASSLAGELPVDQARPQVWVDNDSHAARARDFIDEFFRRPPPGPPVRCPQCREENPGTFEVCWNCATPLGDY